MNELKLPQMCYSTLPSSGDIIIIKKGEHGYHETDLDSKFTNAELLNEKLSVNKQQAEAMLIGSLFGWDVPLANPNNYYPDGWAKDLKECIK
jgi:hypothetical protein